MQVKVGIYLHLSDQSTNRGKKNYTSFTVSGGGQEILFPAAKFDKIFIVANNIYITLSEVL